MNVLNLPVIIHNLEDWVQCWFLRSVFGSGFAEKTKDLTIYSFGLHEVDECNTLTWNMTDPSNSVNLHRINFKKSQQFGIFNHWIFKDRIILYCSEADAKGLHRTFKIAFFSERKYFEYIWSPKHLRVLWIPHFGLMRFSLDGELDFYLKNWFFIDYLKMTWSRHLFLFYF